MSTTGAARAKETTLARSATISIRNQEPSPCGRVEVAPWTGRVHFVNRDKKEYRLRFWKPDTEPLSGIDILLPAKGRATVMIKKGDIFHFGVFPPKGEAAALGKGGGPIVN
ncbi:MAG TPA: hypothetical protein VNY81_00285 [Candidatus Saccharimonadales bacterium]|nr:hypothetical protein [Candidatus Saccharimonadales bacterium]